uniref:Uncharacterized protein n=2 Tax=Ciona intestinalis TaxID=7719 RepID=F6VSV8_CIOIN
MMALPHFLQQIWKYRSTLVIIFTPVMLLPLPLLVTGKEFICGYITLVMAIYWITEVIPLAVTSLIPLIVFPLTGIMTSKEVSKAYFIDTNWLFIGGLMIAIGMENTGLHKRIALRALLLFGTSPQSLFAGFMVASFFISMWISNTATVAMILPVVNALMGELEESKISMLRKKRANETVEAPGTNQSISGYENPALNTDDLESRSNNGESQQASSVVVTQVNIRFDAEEEANTKRMKLLRNGVTVCVTFAATIGGLCTIIGTPSNSVLVALYEELYPQTTQDLTFVAWMKFGVPVALAFLVLTYLWLIWLYVKSGLCGLKTLFACSGKTEDELNTESVIKSEYKKLGSMR